jgi:hypothetical protein
MEGNTSSRDALNDGDQIAVAAFNFLDDFLIAVDEYTNLVGDAQLDALGNE